MSHSLKWISAELNDSGIKTVSRKGKWEPTTLKNIFREELCSGQVKLATGL